PRGSQSYIPEIPSQLTKSLGRARHSSPGPRNFPAMLDVTDLLKCYGRTTALERVSFRVGAGELFGLLGPNGAGKSTLISILTGLAWPTAGSARLDGELIAPDAPAVRRRIGLVPQDL